MVQSCSSSSRGVFLLVVFILTGTEVIVYLSRHSTSLAKSCDHSPFVLFPSSHWPFVWCCLKTRVFQNYLKESFKWMAPPVWYSYFMVIRNRNHVFSMILPGLPRVNDMWFFLSSNAILSKRFPLKAPRFLSTTSERRRGRFSVGSAGVLLQPRGEL